MASPKNISSVNTFWKIKSFSDKCDVLIVRHCLPSQKGSKSISAARHRPKQLRRPWPSRSLILPTLIYCRWPPSKTPRPNNGRWRSEEHTSELQSRGHLVCRLLLEKKKYTQYTPQSTELK